MKLEFLKPVSVTALVGSISLRNVLVRNTLLLAVVQASHYVLVLVTMPYLTRVLGVEQFGLLGITSEILTNLMVFTDWGFGLSAIRDVARNSRNPEELRRIFWDTMAAKSLLVVISLGLIFIIMACVGFNSPLAWLVLCGFVQIVSGASGVGWFLRGLEIMGPMAAAELIGRLAFIPLIFLFVRGPSDTIWAVAIGGVGGLISGVISLYYANRAIPLFPIGWTWSGAIRQLRGGWHIFLSIAASLLYSQINVVVLGAVAGPAQAGLLFGAQKLQRTSKSLIGPLGSALYPRVNNLLVENPDHAIRLMKRLLFVQGAMSFAIFIFLFATAPYLTVIFFGADFAAATPAVRILSATVFMSGLNGVLGTQVMLAFGMQRSFMHILVASGLFNLFAIGPFAHFLGATGASISVLLTEIIITAAMGIVVWRAGIFSKKAGGLNL
ncbi:MAG TPA: flippase [Methylocella sp.]|nr:flippase [Methylocella sp.]